MSGGHSRWQGPPAPPRHQGIVADLIEAGAAALVIDMRTGRPVVLSKQEGTSNVQ